MTTPSIRCAALNTGPDTHLLDHIAPLADLMDMPLIVTEERNEELAKKYYPQVSIQSIPDLEFKLKSLPFDALFECKYWPLHLKELLLKLHKKKTQLIFCPHGQSDKGHLAPLLAPYAYQDAVLLYGDLHREMLQNLNIPIPRNATVGNYRYAFYLKYQSFYDALIEKEIFSKLDPQKPTLLYAPTWKDADNATSFFDWGPEVIQQLPADWNLLIKLHPLLEQRDPGRYYSIAALADRKPNTLLLDDCPLIYPILSRTAAYLGDFSSVGYDFLKFNRPLFFLPTSRSSRLHSCGHILTSPLYQSLEQHLAKTPKQSRQTLYEYAFGKPIAQEEIRSRIIQSLERGE